LASDKKRAAESGRSLLLIDESGFMLQPVVRRTWAPRGQTPLQYSWDRHDRLSVIAGLTVSPQTRRVGLYFTGVRHNIANQDVVDFLRGVRRQLGRDLVVVLDRLNAHRTAVRRLTQLSPSGYQFEWLPAYAPDLNPVEQVWTHTKYADLANFIPEDLDDLEVEVTLSLDLKRGQQELIRSFFRHAGITI
jgi:transposase